MARRYWKKLIPVCWAPDILRHTAISNHFAMVQTRRANRTVGGQLPGHDSQVLQRPGQAGGRRGVPGHQAQHGASNQAYACACCGYSAAFRWSFL